MLKRKILLVDDNNIDREILSKILEREYDIIEATNGAEALEILQSSYEMISLILLDIFMPVMDGFEFLDIIQDDDRFSAIPVIIETSSENSKDEIRCLSMGASDYIIKPYTPEIIKHRVSGIIRLRESAAIINMIETDKMTGLLTKEFFYQYAQRTLVQNPDKQYDIVCCDIVKFKMIKERYGVKKGNEVIKYIAIHLAKLKDTDAICGYLGSDKFAMLCNHMDFQQSIRDGNVQQIKEMIQDAPVPTLDIKFGIYRNVDRNMPVSRMCDRASLALNRIKGIYDTYISEYDDSLRVELLKEQKISDDMEHALADGQFFVCYQPQHEIDNNDMSGAEALVRWRHPEFGMISPGEFIPIFEKNGFITKVDYFVWDEVCRKQSYRKKNNLPMVPISVNVSRVDFESTDLVKHFGQLIQKYEIEPEMLPLEITETVYTVNPQKIIDTVTQLRNIGFKVEMDDFGAGYSSLNMLSELPIDVLKLDMRFVQNTESDQKKSITSFVIALAKWLQLDTIAEGVETADQMQVLKDKGCRYVQGFYFSKPIPSDDFDLYFTKHYRTELNRQEIKRNESESKETDKMEAKTILIVEDTEMNRELLKIMLEDKYVIRETENGREALDFLESTSEKISLILLDLVMPVMDGFEFIKTVKNNEKLKSIPVIITSEAGKDSELRALRLGADDFVAKPYEKEIVQHHVECAIDSSQFRMIRDELESSK